MNQKHLKNTISPRLYRSGFALCLVLLCTACASTPSPKPLWASYDTIETVYPNAEYIARIGTGDSAQTAALLAEGALGSYFSHTVSSSATASQSMTSAAGASTSESRTIERTVTVESLMQLTAVHKTSPYFDRAGNHYVCCAYINREEAWRLHEARLFSEREHFMAFVKAAQAEDDSLKRMLLLKKTREAAEDYLAALDFARLLSPAKEAAYAKDRIAISRLDSEWTKAKTESVMLVTVTQDNENRIFRCMTGLLSEEGFVLTAKPFQAVYKVLVLVEPNKVRHGDMLTADPGISVSLSNGTEQVFSYTKTLERISGFSEAEGFVDKKIYAALEDELRASFLTELRAILK